MAKKQTKSKKSKKNLAPRLKRFMDKLKDGKLKKSRDGKFVYDAKGNLIAKRKMKFKNGGVEYETINSAKIKGGPRLCCKKWVRRCTVDTRGRLTCWSECEEWVECK